MKLSVRTPQIRRVLRADTSPLKFNQSKCFLNKKHFSSLAQPAIALSVFGAASNSSLPQPAIEYKGPASFSVLDFWPQKVPPARNGKVYRTGGHTRPKLSED